MLSKSSARRFFLIGTVACSAAFILLTLDTIRQVPKLTNEHKLTAEVIRGKELWDSKNCMGCHTLLGEGAYYAPELTKVFERRGAAFIKAILKDPASMYPGQRKMVNYHLSDSEISDLVAFFELIGQAQLNGYPAKPDLAAPNAAAAPVQQATQVEVAHMVQKPAIFGQVCTACHSLGGSGGAVGPALDGVGSRRDATYLTSWLKDPASLKADSRMPKLPLSPEQIDELVQFLSTLKN